MSVQNCLKAFFEAKKLTCKKRSLDNYKYHLQHFAGWLKKQEITSVLDITAIHIRVHLAELATRRNQGGVHAAYRPIKTFMRWVWDEFDLEMRNPIAKVKVKRPDPAPIPGATIEDIRKLLEVCNTREGLRDEAIILLLLDSGIRATELIQLRWEDINLMTGTVKILHGKGDKFRLSFAGRRTRLVLRKLLKASGSVLGVRSCFHVYTKRTTTHLLGLHKIINRGAKQAGIPAPGLYDFRRAMFLEMLRNSACLV